MNIRSLYLNSAWSLSVDYVIFLFIQGVVESISTVLFMFREYGQGVSQRTRNY